MDTEIIAPFVMSLVLILCCKQMWYAPFLCTSILSLPLFWWPLTSHTAEPWFSCIPEWLHEQWCLLPSLLPGQKPAVSLSTWKINLCLRPWHLGLDYCSKSLTHPKTYPNECWAPKYCFTYLYWMNEKLYVLITITDKDTLCPTI